MTNTEISPEYLLALSKRVDVLSRHSANLRLGTLTQQFSGLLRDNFAELGQLVSLYHQDPIMKQSSYQRCKSELELYCIEKVATLLDGESPQISQIIQKAIINLRESILSLQNLILAQRGAKTQLLEQQKDRIIKALREEVMVKRQYTQQLQERVHELQDQNSKLYSKLITNAKQNASFSSTSPSKIRQFFSSPEKTGSSAKKKQLPVRYYENEIYDILENKIQQESIQDKRSTLDEFLSTYFRTKYGKPLAQQNESGFREVVANLARRQEKVAFVMFQAMIEEECEEGYYLEHKQLQQKALRNIKRYFNQVKGRNHDELEKLLDPKDDKADIALSEGDIQPLLGAIYRSSEVDTLQLIMNELLSHSHGKITAKRLLNQVLIFELRKHMMRIEDVLREIDRLSDRQGRLLTFSQVEYVLARVLKDTSRMSLLHKKAEKLGNRNLTVGQAVELIEKVRWVKNKA